MIYRISMGTILFLKLLCIFTATHITYICTREAILYGIDPLSIKVYSDFLAIKRHNDL
jgi:hypothetical protein